MAAGYRVVQQETRLAAALESGRATDQLAASAIASTAELKAALHAYPAAGQDTATWAPRATQHIESLRTAYLELDRLLGPSGATMKDGLDLCDRLAATETKAREYVQAGQTLLAGDVIYTEARDFLESMRGELTRARTHAAAITTSEVGTIRGEQITLGLAAGGILALAVLILTPAARSRDEVVATTLASPATPSQDDEYARVIPNPPMTSRTPPSAATTATAAPAAPSVATEAAVGPNRGVLQPAEGVTAVALDDAAAVCTELAQASDSREITVLLGKASTVLNASGLIVWMASPDRRELYAVVGTGYDDRLLSRLGAIAREDVNLTAAAFRSGHARTTPATGTSAAALAVPLVTPSGAVGVLSAELRRVDAVDPQQLAVATIFAAQLSMLLGSMVADSLPTAQQA